MSAVPTPNRAQAVDPPLREYQSIRGEIRSGDLLLCAGTSVMSRMIQRATGSPWSHVAFIIRAESIDRLIVLESVESIGVRAVPLSHYVHDYNGSGRGYEGRVVIARHRALVAAGHDRLRHMSMCAADLLGRRYDTAEVLRIAGRILGHGLRIDGSAGRGNGLRRDGSYICSEYVWECFRAAGIEVVADPRGFIAPCDFVRDPQITLLWRVQTGGPGELSMSGPHSAAQTPNPKQAVPHRGSR